MPYCPKCGKQIRVGDMFCLSCGERLDRLPSPPESPSAESTQLTPPVPAMDTSNLYLIGDEGLLRVGTLFPLVAAPIILGIVLGFMVVVFFGFGNLVAMGVVFTLIIAPIFGEYRARRLANQARTELVAKRGARTIPWSSIQYMRMKGRKLDFKSASGWFSTTIDRIEAARLAQKASSVLGENFVTTPEEPSRFSPLTKFFLLSMAIFIVTEGITFAAALTPFLTGEQERYTSLYNTVEKGLPKTIYQQWGYLFLNNVQVALADFVPALGSLVMAVSSYNTGRVFQIVAIHFSVPPSAVVVALFILPHSWVEELSYPLAGALGLYMFTWRRQSYAEFTNWRTRASTKVTLGFACVAFLLAIAAALEVTEPELPLAGALLLWVPVVAVAAYAFLKLRPRIAAALS